MNSVGGFGDDEEAEFDRIFNTLNDDCDDKEVEPLPVITPEESTPVQENDPTPPRRKTGGLKRRIRKKLTRRFRKKLTKLSAALILTPLFL